MGYAEPVWYDTAEPQEGALAGGMDAFSESSRRAALRIREIVRANGDMSSFAFEKGMLIRGLRPMPCVIVGSEVAVHIIEYHTRNSAVCSYNRVIRFDRGDVEDDTVAGFTFYMGETPVAERIAVGNGFLPHELANYRVRLPRTGDLRQVFNAIAAGVSKIGVPAGAHAILPFI